MKNFKLKSNLYMFAIVFVVAIFMVGCSSSETNDEVKNETADNEQNEQSEQEKFTFKASFVAAETHSANVALEEKMDELHELSDGRIELDVYPNGVLYGDEREAIEAVQMGNVDMTISTSATLASFSPEFMVFDLPFLFENVDQAYSALDGEFGSEVLETLKDINLVGLGFQENGFRHFVNNKHPITTPEDLDGLKMRILASPVYQDTFDLLGANATPLAFGELYSALQQGTFDGMENPIGLIKDSNFYEVQDYITLSGQVYAPVVTVMNKDSYENMPEDLQQILMDWMLDVNDRQREINQNEEAEVLEMLKEHMEVTELSSEQIKAFKEAVQPIYDKYAEEIGADLVEKATSFGD